MPFSKETLDFLIENRLQDSRTWFQEHKTVYRRVVLEPLRELVTALTPVMLEIDGRVICDPQVDKTICRIWRDTRFSKDPSLYRDTMWIIFKRARMHSTAYPGLYVELGPDGFNYGCGFYDASPGYMNHLREKILGSSPAFAAASRAYEEQSVFQLEGDFYRRPRYAGEPAERRNWLERRNIAFIAESRDFPLLYSVGLADKLTADFLLLKPIYDFLLQTALEESQTAAWPPHIL